MNLSQALFIFLINFCFCQVLLLSSQYSFQFSHPFFLFIFFIHHRCCYLLCRSSRFVIRMSRDSYTHLKRHLQERHLTVLINMIQEHLFIEGLCSFATRVIGGHHALTFLSFFCLDHVYVSEVGKRHFRLSHYFVFQLHRLFEDTVCICLRLLPVGIIHFYLPRDLTHPVDV